MSVASEGQNLVRAMQDHDEETDKERRNHMRHLQKEAFQLANYYFVFQGVIFTAFYNIPSHTKCEYRWVPFTLSALAGFVNLCALSRILYKYKRTLDHMDRYPMRSARNYEAPSSRSGRHDNQAPSSGNIGNPTEPIAVISARHWRLFYVIGCMALFVGFYVVTLIGCWKITCGDKSLKSATPPKNK